MEDLSELVSELQRKLKERDTKITKLEDQVKALKHQQNAVFAGKAELTQKVADLEAENQQLRDSPVAELVQEYQLKLKKKEEEIARIKSGSKSPHSPVEGGDKTLLLQHKVGKLEAELDLLRGELTTERAKADQLVALREQSSELQATVEDLQGQLQAKDRLGEEVAQLYGELSIEREKVSEKAVLPERHKKGTPDQVPLKIRRKPEEVAEPPEMPEEFAPDEVEIIEGARWVCPHCGNNDRRMMREEEDRSVLLNAYPPVYGKRIACGQCGATWRHGEELAAEVNEVSDQ